VNVLSQFGRQRRLWVLGVVLPCCWGLFGCAVDGRSVSIDSNSRIPFFGLELKERQRKSDGPPVHSIRAEQKSESRLDPLGLSKKIGSLTRLGEKRDGKTTSVAPIALPLSETNSSGAQAAVEIDFR